MMFESSVVVTWYGRYACSANMSFTSILQFNLGKFWNSQVKVVVFSSLLWLYAYPKYMLSLDSVMILLTEILLILFFTCKIYGFH